MKDLMAYLYEIGHLKQVKRSGWWMVGITDPESVAEHAFRTCIIGYLLAHLEGADPRETAMICLFHDTAEARTTDLHRLAKHYADLRQGETAALRDQVEQLPAPLADEIIAFQHSYEERSSLEGILAHDADLLECLIQAREYQTRGYREAQTWIDNCQAALTTNTAKQIAEACLSVEPGAWWQALNIVPKES